MCIAVLSRMSATNKTLRTSLLVGSAAWLLALSLACGGSGDDEEVPAEGQASAVDEPAPAPDPFEAHGSTLQRLGSELQRLANSSPQAFRNPARPEDRLGGISHWRNPNRVELRLTFRPRTGGTGTPVMATVARARAGEVYVVALRTGPPATGSPYTAPPPVHAVAQTLRLQIMDHACELPVMDQPAAMDLYGVRNTSIWQNAIQVPDACAAAAAAFQGSTLALSAVSLSVRWASSGTALSRGLDARIDSGSQLRFSRPEFRGR